MLSGVFLHRQGFDPDMIWTCNTLIWSQTSYRCVIESAQNRWLVDLFPDKVTNWVCCSYSRQLSSVLHTVCCPYNYQATPSLRIISVTIIADAKSVCLIKLISFFSLITFTDIRHPEELSLLRPIEQKKKKKNKDSAEEIYDLTEVPLSSGILIVLHLDCRLDMYTFYNCWPLAKKNLKILVRFYFLLPVSPIYFSVFTTLSFDFTLVLYHQYRKCYNFLTVFFSIALANQVNYTW